MQKCVRPSFYEITTHRHIVTGCGNSGCGGSSRSTIYHRSGCGSSGCGALHHRPISACGGGGTGGCGGYPNEGYGSCGGVRPVTTC